MRTFIGALVVLAAASGCANHDDMDMANDRSTTSDRSSERVIDVEMVDNRFDPVELTVAAGRPVTFRFTNTGSARHEALVGDATAQREHMAEMSADTGGDGHHDAGDMSGMGHDGASSAVTVEPGKTEEITTTFDRPGTYLIGCHQPGHWEAGMKATVTVTCPGATSCGSARRGEMTTDRS